MRKSVSGIRTRIVMFLDLLWITLPNTYDVKRKQQWLKPYFKSFSLRRYLKCFYPSSIWCWDLNSQPLDLKSPPGTEYVVKLNIKLVKYHILWGQASRHNLFSFFNFFVKFCFKQIIFEQNTNPIFSVNFHNNVHVDVFHIERKVFFISKSCLVPN